MENKTKSSPLGRAAIGIGLLIILAGLIFTSWPIGTLGALVAAAGLAIGGKVEK